MFDVVVGNGTDIAAVFIHIENSQSTKSDGFRLFNTMAELATLLTATLIIICLRCCLKI